MKTPPEVNEVVKRSFDVLEKVLAERSQLKNDDNIQLSFIFRHAENIFQLGQDVIFLVESDRSRSCPILTRVMLEDLFKLVAAFNGDTTAIEITVNEFEVDCDRMAKWLDPKIYTPIVEELSKMAESLRKDFSITSNKKWTTLACAEASKLEGNYRDAYFHLSSHTHATVTGITVQETTASTGYVIQILIFTVLCAAIHLTHVQLTEESQADKDECERLGDKWIHLMNSGVFARMDMPANVYARL
jgi:hypothetical protein